MRSLVFFIIVTIILSVGLISAQENISGLNDTNSADITPLSSNDTLEGSASISENTTLLNETANMTLPVENATPVDVPKVVSFSIVNFTPTEMKAGDVDIEITIRNTGTVPLQGLVPVMVGRGFFTYDVIPIAELLPGESKVSEVLGHMSEKGTTVFTIKINDQIFYQKVRVTGETTEINQTLIAQIEQDKARNKEAIALQLDELKDKTEEFDRSLLLKEGDYILSEINTADLEKYLQDTRFHLVSGDINLANVSLTLAQNEYQDLIHLLEIAPKRSFWSKINDNILIISTIGGALITIFTLHEIFQKKQSDIKKKLQEKKEAQKEPEKKEHKKK